MAVEEPDQDIIKAIRAGRKETFRQVFDNCYESLCQYAFTLVKDSVEAEDIVQSMFLKLWERRESLDIRQSVRSYLFRAVYNQCMNQLEHRAVKRKHQTEIIGREDVQYPDVFPTELEDNIRRAIEALPPQCKTIFIMSRYEELRYPEIAERLQISVNTIQNQVCKALRILRAELKDTIV